MKNISICEIALVKDSSVKLDIHVSDIGRVAKFVRDFIGSSDREHLIVLALNARGRITSVNEVSVGSVSASIAHPREIFKSAILAKRSEPMTK